MPEPHPPTAPPLRLSPRATHPHSRTGAAVAYAELAVTSNFTFLHGGSHPHEFVEQAARLGHRAIALTDAHTLAGVVRAHVAAKAAGLPLIVGSRLQLAVDAAHAPLNLLVYAPDGPAYRQLCRLLTLGKRRAAKGACELSVHDLLEHQAHLLAVLVPPREIDDELVDWVRDLRSVFDNDRLSLAAAVGYRQDDAERLEQVATLAEHVRVPMVATNDVLYHAPGRQALQDVLTCIRTGCTIEQAGLRLEPNAERHLKPAAEMARLFADHPQAMERTLEIAERCTAGGFTLDQLRYQYPREVVPAGATPIQHLAELTRAGARWRYSAGVPDKVAKQIEHELQLIEELDYPHYFLTVHDIVAFARGRGILCQGRGAAANSAVCYCLDITAVDPEKIDVLFERFVSKERDEPPDIDVDFEHERREEVIQYLYARYGRERAALTAEVITYRTRSAVREVGKALGLSLDAVDRLARHLDRWGGEALTAEHLRPLGFSPSDPTVQRLVQLVGELIGFPRHLSQHVGGFVLTDQPLCELVPIENAAMADRTVIEWDKDDIDALGMLKVDVLGLGMLTAIRKGFDLVERHHGQPLTLARVFQQEPRDDPTVYDMICAADTVGVFQIESRAQMSMLPRLRPRCFYDLVIEVAIVRPGPIQGDMVHPYLKRRNGEEPVTYPDDTVKQVLGKTLGVPLFQEQAMSLAIRCAGFSHGEADGLRRAMARSEQHPDRLAPYGEKLTAGMLARGYSADFAQRCFRQLQGFSQYGFPESHSASFALLVYVSAWLKHHHPAAFTCALLNSQPMGFYAPAQLVRDAKEHGVEVRPVDVTHSQWDCTLEAACGLAYPPLRLGLRMVRGLHADAAEVVADAVAEHGPFRDLASLWRASGVPVTALRRLAEADAFQSMGLDRQQALWQILKLRDVPAPLFEAGLRSQDEPEPERTTDPLPPVPGLRRVAHDYASTGLSLKQHPVHFLRERLSRMHATPAAALKDERRWPHGSPITVAGLVTLRQCPSTARGVIFITLEDETGMLNLVVRPRVYARCRAAVRTAHLVLAHGRVERNGQVVHINVRSLQDISRSLEGLPTRSRDFH